MGKKLVAYFSVTGKTAEAAKSLAAAAGADLYEIKPAVPYTKEDTDWSNKQARSNIEMHNHASRPAIAAKDAEIAPYDTIYIGFPIWWYIAPTIINTFLESYDFAGKRVILFATSGGSQFGRAVDNLKPSIPDAEIIEGAVNPAAEDIAALAAM